MQDLETNSNSSDVTFCPKCRTENFGECKSIRCPMRDDIPTIKSTWDIRKCFEQLRCDKNHSLGLGDIRLTLSQQEQICELVEQFYQHK